MATQGCCFGPCWRREPCNFTEQNGTPKSSLFSVGLDAQALCVMGAGDYESAATILAKQLQRSQDKLSVGKSPPTPAPHSGWLWLCQAGSDCVTLQTSRP